MLIANPIYDGVFKYLMKDKKVAKLLLGAILGCEVIELNFSPTEFEVDIQKSLTVIRLDFTAKIIDEYKEEKLVIIELQKAKLPLDIIRFRKYLGEQYSNDNNIISKKILKKKKDGTTKIKIQKVGLPIISIYFLGHKLNFSEAPVIKVTRKCLDLATNKPIKKKEDFIESLTHDSFIIQIPYIPGKRRTELEQLLGVFDQTYKTSNDKHILNIKENEIPQRYRPILRRLLKAMSEPKIRKRMTAEDGIIEHIKNFERELLEHEAKLEEKEKAIQEQKKAIQEQEKVIEERNQQLAEAKEAQRQRIIALSKQKLSIELIASIEKISTTEILTIQSGLKEV